MDRDIPENDAALLRNACGIPVPEGVHPDRVELPPAVVEMYWKFKRVKDRVCMGDLSAQMLAMIVLLAGLGQEIKEVDNPTQLVPDLYRRKEIKFGDQVLARWRKTEKEGAFMGVSADGKNVLVQFPGDAEVREIPAAEVKVAETADL